MKTIFLIIGFLLGIGSYAQTQEEQLKEHNWYIYKVVLNEEEYYPLINEETENVSNLSFYQNKMSLLFCTEISETIGLEFIGENEFLYTDMASFGSGCNIYENYEFYDKYWQFWVYEESNNQYNYVINDVDGATKELIVTKLSNGNKAYYYSSYLSSESYIFEEAKIYPNPAQTVINVELPASEYQNVIFDLYDISGKKLKTFTKSWRENIQLNTSDLPAGYYLLEFNLPENTGRGYLVKLIKE